MQPLTLKMSAVTVKAYRSSDKCSELKLTCDTTLAELKKEIKKARDYEEYTTLYLWHHWGDEIRYDDSSTLREIFGEKSNTIEVDYAERELGPVKVACESSEVGVQRILDRDLSLKTIQHPNPQDVFLSSKRFYSAYPKKLVVVEREFQENDTSYLEVREYCLMDKGPITIGKRDGEPEVRVQANEGRTVAYSKNMATIWMFQHAGGNDYVQVKGQVLPMQTLPIELDEEISQDLKMALTVSEEVYKEEKNEDIGGTKCLLRQENNALFVGFRGSKDLNDWLSNLLFRLDDMNDMPEEFGSNAKVHAGFKERSDAIIKNLPQKILEKYNELPLPRKIVLCGHSLGAAICQLVHINLLNAIQDIMHSNNDKRTLDCKVKSITFAAPMVGNMPMSKTVNKDCGKSMYHIVLAEDIVPAALFTEFAYQNLPTVLMKKVLKDEIIKKLQGQQGENIERAKERADLMKTLKTPQCEKLVYDHSNDSAFAPLGHYLYLKKREADPHHRMYQLRFNDPQYIGYALIPALKIVGEIGSIELIRKKLNGTLETELMEHEVVKKIGKNHAIVSYRKHLTDAGFIQGIQEN